jgi:hypothetical protein
MALWFILTLMETTFRHGLSVKGDSSMHHAQHISEIKDCLITFGPLLILSIAGALTFSICGYFGIGD